MPGIEHVPRQQTASLDGGSTCAQHCVATKGLTKNNVSSRSDRCKIKQNAAVTSEATEMGTPTPTLCPLSTCPTSLATLAHAQPPPFPRQTRCPAQQDLLAVTTSAQDTGTRRQSLVPDALLERRVEDCGKFPHGYSYQDWGGAGRRKEGERTILLVCSTT